MANTLSGIPSISKNDFTYSEATGSPGSSGYKGAGYYLTPEARARIGSWADNDYASRGWGGADGGDSMGGGSMGLGFDQYFNFGNQTDRYASQATQNPQTGEWGTWVGDADNPTFRPISQATREEIDKGFNDFWNRDSISGAYKSGDKQGTAVKWVRQGDSFVPAAQSAGFNVNTNNDHTEFGKSLASFATLGAGGAGLLGDLGQGLNVANFATGGQIPYLSQINQIANLGSNAAGLASNGINTLGDVASAFKTGTGAYKLGSSLYGDNDTPSSSASPTNNGSGSPNMTTPPQTQFQGDGAGYGYSGSDAPGGTPNTGSPNTGAPNTGTPTEGNPTEPSGNFDLSNLWNLITGSAGGGKGLADLWSAWEGSRQSKDFGNKLQGWYTDELGRRQPYLDRLNESYTNPNSFFDSNQWKGLESVYQNSIDRKAGQSGRLANPTDREVLLQNYAMKNLEDYRTGLRGNAGIINPNQTLQAAVTGAKAEQGANNPWSALLGSAGGPNQASQIGNIIKAVGGIQNLPPALQEIIKKISGGGGSSGPGTPSNGGTGGPGVNPDHGGIFEGDYPPTETPPTDVGEFPGEGPGVSDPGWAFGGDPNAISFPNSGNFNWNSGGFEDTGNGNWNDLPIDDFSWLDGFDTWF